MPAARLPGHVELAAYFVVSEALTNVAKYASATHASVTATKRKRPLKVQNQHQRNRGAKNRGGQGLRGHTNPLAKPTRAFTPPLQTGA